MQDSTLNLKNNNYYEMQKNYIFEENLSYKIYCKQIKKYQQLDRQNEEKYVFLAQKGEEEARQKLINSNLRLVIKIANTYAFRNPSISKMDLIQAGNFGLVKAVNSIDKFDPSRKIRFITYASAYINQSIRDFLDNCGLMIRVPKSKFVNLRLLQKVESKLEKELKRKPTFEEIVAYIPQLTEEKIRVLYELYRLRSSEYIRLSSNVADTEYTYPIKNSNADDPFEVTSNCERAHIVQQILQEALKPREAEIIVLRFGIGCAALTLKEVGEKFNLTRERIRQIEKKAMQKIKNFIQCNFLRELLN